MLYRSLRLATAAALVVCACALTDARATAGPATPAPSLPAPTGTVLHVTTEAELQTAMRQLQSNTTIVLAPGTYRLTRTLYINGAYSNVGIRGATNNPDDVILLGAGMANASYGGVPYGIWTGGNVQDVTIANLSIRNVYFHPIIFNAGTERPLVHNVHLVDAGQQFVKVNPDGQGGGVDGGVLQYSTIEFTTRARDDYPKGIDIHTATGWRVRHNLFRNLQAPAGRLLGPAVLVWNGSSHTIVESNTFVNCQREIMFGVYDRSPNDHTGGVIRNNMIVRAATVFGDAGIAVFDSPDTEVLHNTVLTSGTYPYPIEYRYASAVNVYIANNLIDGAIRQRENAQAVLQNNVQTATAAMFVAAASGNLHLQPSATAAIDRGALAAGVGVDWDGQARPQGAAPDAGADEFVPAAPAPSPRINVAAASAGAVAVASTTFDAQYPASAAINGDRRGLNWGAGGGWRDATAGAYPDWLQVTFPAAKTITEIDVFTVQDNSSAPLAPTATMTFSKYGVTAFAVQYWNGTQWVTVPGGAITGNRLVWRRVTFPPVTTSRIRVLVSGALANYSRITEVEAY